MGDFVRVYYETPILDYRGEPLYEEQGRITSTHVKWIDLPMSRITEARRELADVGGLWIDAPPGKEMFVPTSAVLLMVQDTEEQP